MQTRLLAIFAVLVTAIALVAGCSSKSQGTSKALPDAATLLKQSSDTTKSQSSVHIRLAVQGEIKELPIESLEGDLATKPAVGAQGTANIVFLGQRLEGVDFAVVDGTLYAALTTLIVTGRIHPWHVYATAVGMARSRKGTPSRWATAGPTTEPPAPKLAEIVTTCMSTSVRRRAGQD